MIAEQRESVFELIRNNDAFEHLDDSEVEALMDIASRKVYHADQLVFSVNDHARHFYLVESGTFFLNIPSRDFVKFKAGDLFGEVAVINERMRTGTIRAREKGNLIAFDGNKLFDEKYLPPKTTLKVVRSLARKVTDYLRLREHITTEELIKSGENELVEFKTSVRWNPHKEDHDQHMEYALLKSVTGFLNTNGGTVIVGVTDKAEITGLRLDGFESDDKLLLHLTRLVKQRIGAIFKKFVHFEIEDIEGKQVLRIDCEPSTRPAYLRAQGREHFFVRTGPSTSNLRVSKIYDYIKMRFYSEAP